MKHFVSLYWHKLIPEMATHDWGTKNQQLTSYVREEIWEMF